MKKFLKNNIKLILVFLLGIIISSGITAYAVNNYMSEQIRYQNNTFAINSVSEALDDLYSYSKEKIDNNTSNNYSTEEQVVGKWIDGKPIYQKTYLSSYSGNLRSTIIIGTAPANLDQPIDGSVAFWANNKANADFIGYNTYAIRTAGDNLILDPGPGLDNVSNIVCSIKYTKTTDTATS